MGSDSLPTSHSLFVRAATLFDVDAAAKLHVLDKDLQWETLVPVFHSEFSRAVALPNDRVYFLVFDNDELIAYAGARSYNPASDENMYNTTELLPEGWYLRGIKVHPDRRRQGLARELTIRRIKWLAERSNHIFVFLDDENKVSLPMYFELGFKEKSRGWNFSDEHRISKGTQGILLERFIDD